MDITQENVDTPVDEALLAGEDLPAGDPENKGAPSLATPSETAAAAVVDKKDEGAETVKTDPAATPAADATPARDGQIPRARFDEVNNKLKEERERADRAEAELKKQKEAPAPDIHALESEYTDAVFEGDKEKALEIRGRINAEIQRKAEDAAVARTETAARQRESDSAYGAVYSKALKDHAFLDPKTGNQEAITETLDWRDFYVARGKNSAEALSLAVAKVAPTYADQEGEKPANVTQIDKRKAEALARAAKESGEQPPSAATAGAGNRGVPTQPAPKTQEDWEKLPEGEREKFLA